MSGDTVRTRARPSRVGGTVAVSSQVRQGRQVVSDHEQVDNTSHMVRGEPARVRVEGSVTQNMGDFNSVRVGISIERPCDNTDDAIYATYQECSDMVDEMIQIEMNRATTG